MKEALTWEELSKFSAPKVNQINGPNNPYALRRLFGLNESAIKVTLYRDHHAWCPYCQKVWLWLEFKRIPYNVSKATMRCYGKKEDWYLQKVPSGIFPAIEIDQTIITESDQILFSLEQLYGPLGESFQSSKTLILRNLERKLFRAWCMWLCNPSFHPIEEKRRQEKFEYFAQEVEERINQANSIWMDPHINSSQNYLPGTADIVFIPYLERMNASLAYYKGFNLRNRFPKIDKWFRALEKLDAYLGTQGDFHTHSHDLPPQMGGCWKDKNSNQKEFSEKIDIGDGLGELETSSEPLKNMSPESIALTRVLKHKESIMKVNPLERELIDQPLRAALSCMILGESFCPNEGSASGLRYIRDRVSVPRDMPLLSARVFRKALEKTATIDGLTQGIKITTSNRLDQNPIPFKITK